MGRETGFQDADGSNFNLTLTLEICAFVALSTINLSLIAVFTTSGRGSGFGASTLARIHCLASMLQALTEVLTTPDSLIHEGRLLG
jgi:hypothetical protein